jgi:hypothetical protein
MARKELPLVLIVDEETHEVFLNDVRLGEYNHSWPTEVKLHTILNDIVELFNTHFD